jgi:hypothetical protein
MDVWGDTDIEQFYATELVKLETEILTESNPHDLMREYHKLADILRIINPSHPALYQ